MRKLFSLIAAVLFAGSMMADSYTITFKSTDGADATASLTSTTVSDYVASGAEYVSAISASGKVYNGQAGYGLKFGNSSSAGAVTMTLATPVAPTSIVMNASPWSATEGAGLLQDSVYETKSTGGKGTFADFAYEYNGTTEVTTIIVGTSAKRGYVKSITVNYGEVVPPTPKVEYYVAGSMNGWASAAGNKDYKLAANPGAEGEYMIEMAFAANDAFKVIGYDGTTTTWYPDGMDNNYIITEAGKYTVYFRPAGGQEGWHYGCINAIKIQAITCAEVYALAKNDKVNLLNDVTVTYANGKNVWVKDATASMLIYLSANTTWQAGDVLSGIAGVVDVYNGIHEVKPSADQVAAVTATPGEAPAAEEVATVTLADVNKYIVMKNVDAEGTFAEGTQSNITINGVAVRNQFKNGYTFQAGKKYDVYGVVTIYQSNPQVYFIKAEASSASAIDNAAIETKAIKRIENGKLVIIKNGVRFDAQGIRL